MCNFRRKRVWGASDNVHSYVTFFRGGLPNQSTIIIVFILIWIMMNNRLQSALRRRDAKLRRKLRKQEEVAKNIDLAILFTFQTIRRQQLVILELQAGQDGHNAKAEEGREQMGLDGKQEEQEVVKEEEEEEEEGHLATDSDSGVVVGEGGFWLEAGVGRSVSGVMARQEGSSKQVPKSRAELEAGKRFELETEVKRVYINHRSVTRVRDLKYRRITRTKARSMEELREKLREGPLFTKEEGFSHA